MRSEYGCRPRDERGALADSSHGGLRLRRGGEVLLPTGIAFRAQMDLARRGAARERTAHRAVVFLRHRHPRRSARGTYRFRGLQLEDVRIALHVHEPVAADVERDRLRLARLLALEGLVDRARDAVRALGGGEEPLGLDELPRAGEHVLLVRGVRTRVDVPEGPG